MFSFFQPCLRWKILVGIKQQVGFPGFVPPYNSRYLQAVFTGQVYQTFDGTFRPDLSGTQTVIYDRITGQPTFTTTGGGAAFTPLPYGSDVANDPAWQEISEDHYQWTFRNDEFYGTIEAQLSNPYPVAQLEADAEALIASIRVADMPWDTGITAYDIYPPNGPYLKPDFDSAAGYQYILNPPASPNFGANQLTKWIGYVAMAGKYCERTAITDGAGTLINELCVSGIGLCATPFKVTPPAVVVGQNATVIVVPNCQCGG